MSHVQESLTHTSCETMNNLKFEIYNTLHPVSSVVVDHIDSREIVKKRVDHNRLHFTHPCSSSHTQR